MKRGDVYDANLDPAEGSEQAGTRPVIIVSRDSINDASPVVLIVPCIKYRGQLLYLSHVLVPAPEGGLDVDSVAMAELLRPLVKARLGQYRGTISKSVLMDLNGALFVALGLPEQLSAS